jgi:hypothetical protein
LTPVTIDGVQCVYDNDAADITQDATTLGPKGLVWLADANFAASNNFGISGINPDGSMTWETAINWINALNNFVNSDGTIGYLGHTNWSLPGTLQHDPGHTLTGPTGDSFGYNNTLSPMDHLFYTEFGGQAGDTISTLPNKAALAQFKNLQPYYYWSGTWEPTRTLPADFSFGSGFLGTDKDLDFEYVIPEFSATPQPDGSFKQLDASNLPSCIPDNSPNSTTLVLPPPVPPPPTTLSVNPDGTIHDAALNINWLANANLAKTNSFGLTRGLNPNPYDDKLININPDGSMSHDTAVAWIAAMNQADYLGHNNWRLPDSPDLADQGYYKTDTEMGELFYTELGSQAGSTIQRTHNGNLRLFQSIQPYYYWSGSPANDRSGTDTSSRESFSFASGYRSDNTHTNFMYVIPVYDSPQVVTKDSDDGEDDINGSLRQVIDQAHGGDTIVFSPELTGQTITLQSPIKINQDDEFENKVLNLQGPGAGRQAISGNNMNRIFHIGPNLSEDAVAGVNATRISGLTLENGQSDQGGAILDEDASLILFGDVFKTDRAVGGPGGDGRGGALAIVNTSNSDMLVLITGCQFSNDTAFGGAGNVDKTGNESTGGDGKGGAIYVDAGSSTGLAFAVIDTQFTNDSAVGGNGVNADSSAGVVATDGGNGLGGAVFLSTDAAGVPFTAFFGLCSFADCSAIGGEGGSASGGMPCGQNGAGYGGGLFIGPSVSAYGFVVAFKNNHADFGPDYYGILTPIWF